MVSSCPECERRGQYMAAYPEQYRGEVSKCLDHQPTIDIKVLGQAVAAAKNFIECFQEWRALTTRPIRPDEREASIDTHAKGVLNTIRAAMTAGEDGDGS